MFSSETFKPSSASDYPDITPKEIGQRFLKLVDGLRSIDELSPERVAEATRLPMRYAPAGKLHSFTIHEPKTGWYYALDYYKSPGLGWKTASLEFRNPGTPDADMAPVCGMDFEAYAAVLKSMGFTMADTRDEFGRIVEYRFYRGAIRISVLPRYEAQSSEEKLGHPCVESISVHGAD
ncbi:hypothetical protein A7A76_23335 [Lysobacter enzymogenes]|nr:hypothetical protein [Lysobacter enzymogenes]